MLCNVSYSGKRPFRLVPHLQVIMGCTQHHLDDGVVSGNGSQVNYLCIQARERCGTLLPSLPPPHTSASLARPA